MANLSLNWSRLFLHTASNVNVHVPESAGVYRLSCDSAGKILVFYVGQAENLRQRLQSHLLDVEPNVCIQRYLRNYTCYFCFAPVAKKSDRDFAERALQDHFTPECNYIPVPAKSS